jgi:transposase
VGRSRSGRAGARDLSNIEGIAPGVQQAERRHAIGETEEANKAADAVCGTDDGVFRRFGVRDRVGGAAWKNAHSMERDHGSGSGAVEPDLVGVGVIQITPQMKILVAIEAVDGRKGIDSLARLCEEKLQADPFSGCMFLFRSRRGTSIRILVYDGQGFWLAQKRLSKGRFVWWPTGKQAARVLEAHQAQLLLAAGNPETAAAPVWRRVSTFWNLRSSFGCATLRHAFGVEVSWPGHHSRRHHLHPAVH